MIGTFEFTYLSFQAQKLVAQLTLRVGRDQMKLLILALSSSLGLSVLCEDPLSGVCGGGSFFDVGWNGFTISEGLLGRRN